MWQLKSHNNVPPGCYYYMQTEGKQQKFNPCPVINDVARNVYAFRKANNLPRATLAEALMDVDAYTCARLKNNPVWCFNTDVDFAQTHQDNVIMKPPCTSCGAVVQ